MRNSQITNRTYKTISSSSGPRLLGLLLGVSFLRLEYCRYDSLSLLFLDLELSADILEPLLLGARWRASLRRDR